MGGADCYCAFCGCPAFELYNVEDYQSDFLRNEDVQWLGKVRLIGKRTLQGSDTSDRIWISGPATHDDLNHFNVEVGSDPNFPSDIEYINAYGEDEAVPVHETCFFHVLPAVLRWLEGAKSASQYSTIDLEILWDAISSLMPEEDFGRCLDISYGVVSDLQEQYWTPEPGGELWVVDPTALSTVNEYFSTLPQTKTQRVVVSECECQNSHQLETKHSMADDVFEKLPYETMTQIMDSTSMSDIRNFKSVSRSVSDILCNDSWWFSRALKDHGWAYDTLVSHKSDTGTVCWNQVYKDLCAFINPKLGKRCIPAAVNRDRIFTTCTVIADAYMERKAALDRVTEFQRSTSIPKTTRSSAQIISKARQKKGKPFTLNVLTSWETIGRSEVVLKLVWNQHRRLKQLSVISRRPEEAVNTDGGCTETTITLCMDSWVDYIVLNVEHSREDNDIVPEGIIGITIITTTGVSLSSGSTDGCRKVLMISKGHIFCGFYGDYVDDHQISKIGLLQNSAQLSGMRDSFQAARVETFASVNILDPKVTKYTWKRKLPPTYTTLSSLQSGYWVRNHVLASAPLEVLSFGNTREEQKKVVGVFADGLLGGLGVRFVDGKMDYIGVQLTGVKEFQIDGPGGEFIKSIFVSSAQLPMAIRLVTNRGRQCVFGAAEYLSGNDTSMIAESSMFAGIYAGWGYGGGDETPQTLHGIGVILTAAQYSTPNPDLDPEQTQVAYLEPEAPPEDWQPTGTIFPSATHGIEEQNPLQPARSEPSSSSLLSWLDLSQSLRSMTLFLCHPHGDRPDELTLVGLKIRYQTNIDASIGINCLQNNVFHTEKQCFCHLGPGGSIEGIAKAQHYSSISYDIDDQLLTEVHLWYKHYIQGIKFVFADKSETPVYGCAQGAPQGLIKLNTCDTDGTAAMGLKFYLDTLGVPVTRTDVVVRGIEVLYRVEAR